MTWPEAPLDAVAEIQGGIQKQPKRAPRDNAFPFLRVANVTASGLALDDVHEVELFDGELDRLRLQRGDLLVVEGNGSASQIGRAVVWDGSIKDAVHQNHLIRVRPAPDLDARYLGLLWNSPTIRDELSRVASSTSGLHTLSVTKLKRIRVPLPPLAEQHRIVDLLEDHLSRLDAATAYLDAGCRRAALLLHSARESIWEVTQDRASIAELGEVITGKTPPTRDLANSGDEVPFVTPGDLAHGDVLGTVNRSISEHGARSSRTVEEGSVLTVCIGATLGKVGYTEGRVAFNQQINAVRLTTVDEAQLLAAAMSAPTFQRKMREASSATTMPILNKSSFSRLLVPRVPSAAREGLLDRIRESSEAVERLRKELDVGVSRSAALRRSLLAAAFSGRLTRDASDQSEAEEMINA